MKVIINTATEKIVYERDVMCNLPWLLVAQKILVGTVCLLTTEFSYVSIGEFSKKGQFSFLSSTTRTADSSNIYGFIGWIIQGKIQMVCESDIHGFITSICFYFGVNIYAFGFYANTSWKINLQMICTKLFPIATSD